MSEARTAIELRSVSKAYSSGGRRFSVLRKVSLTIAAGEHVAVMGPSGSGKSTLLSVLGCLDSVDDGQYIFFGRDVSLFAASDLARLRNREMGFVFQNLSLLSELTVLDNVMLPFQYGDVSQATALSASAGALESVGMGEFAQRMPRELSGGQQQRVAIARAIANRPRLVLADEPTGALDQASARDVLDLFQALHRTGITLLTVTHDVVVARRADRLLEFADGNFQ
ncbi:putative ABC transporter ATP-binding protein YknY [Stenotrophomonas lactitubi]|nr:macrolide ABC transporter ATP-binding protein [Stenotrophomonas sp. HMWF023]PTT58868.1 macrolide ABC transporter ATP-binding protein [Stenotrophomonas sp. HMWF022]CAH0212328.1 putative ABC transporter ATP-binding protein YknY [Stenotrophomonas lactitubi]CAH0228716.1 putative ABC transporter ATP-binding protein YknY [Stenotrophomonas lactitubi]CAH0242273.1 putative ABC transporter ATP-binding protein YknY [Stenotrophomonas lactitubi]